MKNELNLKSLIVPVIVMLAFWGVAILGWSQSGSLRPLFMFSYIGTSLGVLDGDDSRRHSSVVQIQN